MIRTASFIRLTGARGSVQEPIRGRLNVPPASLPVEPTNFLGDRIVFRLSPTPFIPQNDVQGGAPENTHPYPPQKRIKIPGPYRTR